jgi:hypothetical protein
VWATVGQRLLRQGGSSSGGRLRPCVSSILNTRNWNIKNCAVLRFRTWPTLIHSVESTYVQLRQAATVDYRKKEENMLISFCMPARSSFSSLYSTVYDPC